MTISQKTIYSLQPQDKCCYCQNQDQLLLEAEIKICGKVIRHLFSENNDLTRENRRLWSLVAKAYKISE
jgi:hypothetical protein